MTVILSKIKTRNFTIYYTYAAFIPFMAFLVYREVVEAAEIVEQLDCVFHAALHTVLVNLGTKK